MHQTWACLRRFETVTLSQPHLFIARFSNLELQWPQNAEAHGAKRAIRMNAFQRSQAAQL